MIQYIHPQLCAWLLIIGAVGATILAGALIDRFYLRRRALAVRRECRRD
ncbi:hypothetical protein [uncultured Duncaniella sp.]|nr:hypothetical protein [uncultured Duncaniella sp.]